VFPGAERLNGFQGSQNEIAVTTIPITSNRHNPNEEKENAINYWKSDLFFTWLAETSHSTSTNKNG
jgi:hypothetical protein